MTTIAYRNGVIASDSIVLQNDVMTGLCQKKIGKIGNYLLYGFAGSIVDLQRFLDWVTKQPRTLNFDKLPKFVDENTEVFIVYKSLDGMESWVFITDEGVITDLIYGEYFALGVGCQFALGAMAAGASAVKAIEAACIHDIRTRAPIISLSF